MILSSWLMGFQRSLAVRSRARSMRHAPVDLPKTSSDRNLSTRIEQFESRWLMSNTPVVFTVNTINDSVDVKIGDGLAEDASGKTSLRAAIQEANAASSGSFEIVLDAQTYTLTRSGTNEDAANTGDLDITNPQVSIAIRGTSGGAAPTIIDGNSFDRVFDVLSGANLSLMNLTVQGGSIASDFGGGVRNDFKDGLISLDAHLHVSRNVLNHDHRTIDDHAEV